MEHTDNRSGSKLPFSDTEYDVHENNQQRKYYRKCRRLLKVIRNGWVYFSTGTDGVFLPGFLQTCIQCLLGKIIGIFTIALHKIFSSNFYLICSSDGFYLRGHFHSIFRNKFIGQKSLDLFNILWLGKLHVIRSSSDKIYPKVQRTNAQ